MQGAQQKKATEEQVKKMSKGLMANHDKIMGSLGSGDVASTFASTDDMEGISAGLGDISALAPQDASDIEEENEDVEGDEQEESKNPPKPKWFDKDRSVVRATKQLDAAVGKVKEMANKVKEELTSAIKKVQDLPVKEQMQFRGEISIAQSRQGCLAKLFGTTSQLRDRIQQIKSAGNSGGSQTSSADPMKALGSAPPSQSFEDLQTFEDVASITTKLHDASDNDEIEQVKKEAMQARAPIQDLISASKSAIADINKGLKAYETQLKKQAAAKPSTKTVQSPDAADGFALTGRCQKVQMISEGTFQPHHFDCPVLIQLDGAKQRAFDLCEPVKKFMLGDFLPVFQTQSSAQRCERAHRRLPPLSDIRAAVLARTKEICQQAVPAVEDVQRCEDTFQSMDAVAVIVGKNSLSCAPEKSYVGPKCVQHRSQLFQIFWPFCFQERLLTHMLYIFQA